MLEIKIDIDGSRTYWVDGIQTDEATAFAERDKRQAEDEAKRQSSMITPLPIDGATVDEVKTSAEIVIADLAQQMQAKIDAIIGGV